MGGGRTDENVVALRAVRTTDFMTAHWAELPYSWLAKVSNRITNEVRGFNRVVHDVSGKPPATLECEQEGYVRGPSKASDSDQTKTVTF